MKAKDLFSGMTIRDMYSDTGVMERMLGSFSSEQVQTWMSEYERNEVAYILTPDGKNPMAQVLRVGGKEETVLLVWSTPAAATRPYTTIKKAAGIAILVRVPMSLLENFDYCLDMSWEETGIPFQLTKPSGTIIRHGHDPIIL